MQKNQYLINQYQKSKIFRMTSPQTDKIYFSGTYNKLSTRKGVYRNQYKLFQQNCIGKYHPYYEIMKYPDFKLVLVEEFPCHSRAMLNARIQHWVDNNECLNRGKDFKPLPTLVHPDSVEAAPKQLKTIIHPKAEIDDNEEDSAFLKLKENTTKLVYLSDCSDDVSDVSETSHEEMLTV